LKSAKRPLVIVGKGVAYGDASKEMNAFINSTNLPFLSTPMGKGTVSDEHPNFVGPARSMALQKADVIFLCCARLNWILHFGKPPRFAKDVKIIQMDNDTNELNNNVKSEVILNGDVLASLKQVNSSIKGWKYPAKTDWRVDLTKKIENNKKSSEVLYNDKSIPMTYYSSLHIVQQMLPRDCMLINEGANTMDIGRTILKNYYPKKRLDAGTYGTMGICFPFAIAAKILNPQKRVVMVVGDSAFGFSAMELETAMRYNLPLTVIIINNNGIYSGVPELPEDRDPSGIPVTALSPEAKYEKIAEAFGGKGIKVTTHSELSNALNEAFDEDKLHIINVAIDPSGSKKPQEFAWLTREEPKAKL
jgi:2-hydroxyacyl-CoA lyase 1